MTQDKAPMTQSNYTVRELAELAGVNPSRIRQLLGEPNGPFQGSHKRGGVWFIPVSVAHRWLELRDK